MSKIFYDTKEVYPFLLDIFTPDILIQIKNELLYYTNIKEQSNISIIQNISFSEPWIEWPETYLYKNKMNWNVIPLYWTIPSNEKGIRKCNHFGLDRYKTLKECLEKIPNLKNVLFSRMSPNSQLKEHIGQAEISNYILRCHIPIDIPSDCALIVNKQLVKYEINKIIVFDDSLPHYTYNKNMEKERIILIVDIKRPEGIPLGKSQVFNSLQLTNLDQLLS